MTDFHISENEVGEVGHALRKMFITTLQREHRCRSRQTFEGEKDVCPNFLKLVRKVICATFAYKVAPTQIMKTCIGVTQNRRQKVVNREALLSCREGLAFKFVKNSTNK